MRLGDE